MRLFNDPAAQDRFIRGLLSPVAARPTSKRTAIFLTRIDISETGLFGLILKGAVVHIFRRPNFCKE